MRRVRLWSAIALIVLVGGGVLFAWWNLDLRWRPKTISRDQAAIAADLRGAGWVSSGQTGPKLYVLATRNCEPCASLMNGDFDRLHAAGVDTRVIMIARADRNGQTLSTPAERTTVAALWLDRDWGLLRRWMATPPADWTAPGLPPADGDAARTAVVGAGQALLDRLTPLLRRNGVKAEWPILIWWTPAGVMQGCACAAPQARSKMEKALGA